MLQFATYQAKNGKVTAVATMQRDPIVAKASELLRLDLMPSLDEIRNGKVSLRSIPVLAVEYADGLVRTFLRLILSRLERKLEDDVQTCN